MESWAAAGYSDEQLAQYIHNNGVQIGKCLGLEQVLTMDVSDIEPNLQEDTNGSENA